MTMQCWEGDGPAKERRHYVCHAILLSLIALLLYFIAGGLYDAVQAEHPPRDVAPRAYETVHVVRFEDTVCWRCHRP